MTDAQVLLLALGALYLWECFLWVPRGTIVLRRFGLRARAGVHDGTRLPGIHTAGVLFSDPLPPFGLLAVTSWLPASFSPAGALSYVAAAFNPGGRPDQSERWAPFGTMRTIAARDRDVLIDGKPFVRAASAPLAAHLAGLLRDLRGLPEPERAGRIEPEIERTFDADAVRGHLERFEHEVRALRWLCVALLVEMFGVVPVVLWARGLIATWPWLLSATLAMSTVVAWRYWVAHARLIPAGGPDRSSAIVAMILCPPLAARAVALVSRDLFATHHPLAVASVLCEPDEYRRLAAGLLLDARFPIRPVCPADAAAEAREAEEWFRGRMRQAIERFVARTAGPETTLLPPLEAQHGALSYCPRCRSQFQVIGGSCADCGGLPLVPLRDVAEG